MPEEKENCTTLYESYDLPISLRDRLKRVDEIHRAITRAVGRIEYLKLSAMRAGSRPTPVRYGRGAHKLCINGRASIFALTNMRLFPGALRTS